MYVYFAYLQHDANDPNNHIAVRGLHRSFRKLVFDTRC